MTDLKSTSFKFSHYIIFIHDSLPFSFLSCSCTFPDKLHCYTPNILYRFNMAVVGRKSNLVDADLSSS